MADEQLDIKVGVKVEPDKRQIAKDLQKVALDPVKIKAQVEIEQKSIDSLVANLQKALGRIKLPSFSIGGAVGSGGGWRGGDQLKQLQRQFATLESQAFKRNNPLQGTFASQFKGSTAYVELTSELKKAQVNIEKAKDLLNELKNLRIELQNQQTAANALGTKTVATRAKEELQQMQVYERQMQETVRRAREASVDVDGVTESFRELQEALNKANQAGADAAAWQAYQSALKTFKTELKVANQDVKTFQQNLRSQEAYKQAQNNAQRYLNEITKIRNEWSKAMSKEGNRTRLSSIEGLLSSGDIDKIKEGIRQLRLFKSEMQATGQATQTFGDKIKHLVSEFAQWFSVSQLIMSTINKLKEMKDVVTEIDTSMTELKKVTSGSDATYAEALREAKEQARDLKTSIDAAIDARAGWSRIGYGLDVSEELGKWSIVYQNVGDGIASVEDATSALVSTLKGFKNEVGSVEQQVEQIVNKFNKVGNETSISSAQIGEALQSSASALSGANNSLSQSIALIVGAYDVVQDASEVGNTWKTVSMRLRGASTDLKEMGEDTEGMVENTAKLREQIMALTGGFDIMKNENEFKSTYEMIVGIGEAYAEMSDLSRAALLELIAGKNRGNAVAAALENVEAIKNAYKIAEDSAGSAMKEYQTFEDSVEAHSQAMATEFQILATNILNSDLIKFGYDAGTGFLGFLNSVTEGLTAIPSLATAASAAVTLFTQKGIFGTHKDNKTGEMKLGTFSQINRWKLDETIFDDMDLLKQYASLLLNGELFDAFEFSEEHFSQNAEMEDDAEAIRLAIQAGGDYTKTLDQIAERKREAIKQTNGYKTSLQGLGNVAKTIGATLANALITAAVSYGLTKLAELIEKQVNAVKYAKDALTEYTEGWSELQKKQESASALVSKYANDYERLSKGVNMVTGENLSLSDDEYELFKQINTELANSALASVEGITVAYDAQGQAIVRLSGQMDGLRDAYKQLEQQTRLGIINDIPEVLKNVQTVLSPGWYTNESSPTKLIEAAERMLEIVEKGYGPFTGIISQMGDLAPYVASLTRAMGRPWGQSEQDFLGGLTQERTKGLLHAFIQQQNAELSTTLNPIREAMQVVAESVFTEDMPSELRSLGLLYISQMPATAFMDVTHSELIANVADFAQQLTDEALAQSINSLHTLQADFASDNTSFGEYKKEAQNLLSAFMTEEFPAEFQQLLREGYGLDDTSTYDRAKTRLMDGLTDATEEWVDTLTASQLNFAMTQDFTKKQITSDRFLALYDESRQASLYDLSEIATTSAAISDAQNVLNEIVKAQGYSASITAEQYKQLVELGDEYAACVKSVNGYMQLDVEATQELVAAKQKEAQATIEAAKAQKKQEYRKNALAIKGLRDALEKNKDASDEYRLAIEARVDALLNEQSAIRSEIDGYNRLASELEYATSAYKKWIDAQESPEAGDAYANMLTAMQQIQEGQESGKIGTNKYKAAVELLVPDERDVATYMSTLTKYITEDSAGLQTFIDDMFANAFLSKDASGRYSFMQGVTVEDIAAGLGLTDELTQYMLQALQDYGWDVNILDGLYADSKILDTFDQLEGSLADAEAELEAVLSRADASAEEIAKAEEKVAEAREAWEAYAEAVAGVPELTLEEQLALEIEKWRAAIAELEALEIPVSAVIGSYIEGPEVNDPNDFVSALGAFIAWYEPSQDANDPNEFVSSLAGKIGWYEPSQDANDPNEFVSSLDAKIGTYSNAEETDPNSLVKNLNATANVNAKLTGNASGVNLLRSAIEAINNLAVDGVIPVEVAASLTGTLTDQLDALDTRLGNYNNGTTKATVTVDANTTFASAKINGIAEQCKRLKDIRIKGGLTTDAEADLDKIIATFEALGNIPEEGYAYTISSSRESEAAVALAQNCQTALEAVGALADGEAISFELAGSLRGTLERQLTTIKQEIVKFNTGVIKGTVTIDGDNQLTPKLEAAKTLCETIDLPTVDGKVNLTYVDALTKIESALVALSGMPNDGYNVNIESTQDAKDVAEIMPIIQEALLTINSLAEDGVIDTTVSFALIDLFTDQFGDIQTKLDEYNSGTKTVDITVTARDQASDEIQAIADGDYNATIGVELDSNDEADLASKLEAVKAQYETIDLPTVDGEVNSTYVDDLTKIERALEALGKMPKEGYTVRIKSAQDAENAAAIIPTIQEALTAIDKLATDGVIDTTVSVTLKDLFTDQEKAIQTKLDEYNSGAKDATVTVDANDLASDKIQAIADGTYEATIGVKLNPDDVEKAQAQLEEMYKSEQEIAEERNRGIVSMDSYNQLNARLKAIENAFVEFGFDADAAYEATGESKESLEFILGYINGEAGISDATDFFETIKSLYPYRNAGMNDVYPVHNEDKQEHPDIAIFEQFQEVIVECSGDLDVALSSFSESLDTILLGYEKKFGQAIEKDGLRQYALEYYNSYNQDTNSIEPPNSDETLHQAEQLFDEFLKAVVEANGDFDEAVRSVQATVDELTNAYKARHENEIDENGLRYFSSTYFDLYKEYLGLPNAPALESTDELATNQKLLDDVVSELVSNSQENYGALDLALESLNVTYEQLVEAFRNLHPELDVGKIEEELFKYLDDETDLMVVIGANTDGVKTAVNNAIKEVEKKKATLPVTATVKTNTSLGSLTGAVGATGRALAEGTRYAKDEDAIVGENGVETIISDGKYYTVGHNGAELVHLNEGDQVLTNSETKRLFGSTKRRYGSAYEDGTTGSVLEKIVAGALAGFKTLSSNKTSSVTGGGGSNIGGTVQEEPPPSVQSSSSAGKADTKWYEDLFDWIARALEVAKEKTTKLINDVKNFIGHIAQNDQLAKAIRATGDELQRNQQAYERYMAQAVEVQQRTQLADDIVQKIHTGSIDIASYDADTREKISQYQEWYEKAQDCLTTIEELREQERELNLQRLDNIITDYENQLDELSDSSARVQKLIELRKATGREVQESSYEDLITNLEEQVGVLQDERDALQSELDHQVDIGNIQQGSEAWHTYRNEIEEINNAIIDAEISMQGFVDEINSLRITKLQNVQKVLQDIQNQTQNILDLNAAQGVTTNGSNYDTLIQNGHQQIANLEQQIALLREQLVGLDDQSEKYQEILEQIRDNEQAIAGIKVSQEQWNDTIADLDIKSLQEQREALEATNKAYQARLDLEEALEALEKAKYQRTKLMYVEGKGFQYVADQDAIDDAQQRVDELLYQQKIDALDEQITSIEKGKGDDNIWSSDGTTVLKAGVNTQSAIYEQMVQSMLNMPLSDEYYQTGKALSQLYQSQTQAAASPIITIGDVHVTGVDNAEALAKDIVERLPNAVFQQLNKN